MTTREPGIKAFREFILSLFGARRHLHPGSCGSIRSKNAVHSGIRFNLDEWVSNQKATYGSRKGLSDDLERRASRFHSELFGLGGALLDYLICQRPRMVPKDFWGGALGWRSVKRKKRWETLLTRNGITISNINHGVLIRFYIDATEWIPHPYAPPDWAVSDFGRFSQYIAPSQEAFKLCVQWRTENSVALRRRVAERIQGFPVQMGASYLCYGRTDYVDVAFLLLDSGTDLLQVRTVWKGEAALAELVTNVFSDAEREYTPSWLRGQRIDRFIPSLKVALEYHGEQHYGPVEYFGGKEGFLRTKERDRRKIRACKNAGVTLIEWKYAEPVNESYLRKKLEAFGFESQSG